MKLGLLGTSLIAAALVNVAGVQAREEVPTPHSLSMRGIPQIAVPKSVPVGFYLTVTPGGETRENLKYIGWMTDTLSASGRIRVPIHWGGASREELEAARKSGQYKYHFGIKIDSAGALSLVAEKWIKDHDSDPDRVGWRLGYLHLQLRLRQLIQRYLEADQHLRMMYEAALSFGLRVSNRLTLVKGSYFDTLTIQEVEFERAFDIFQNERPKHRHWIRMLAEMTLLFGIQEIKYWLDKDVNSFDFEYGADYRSIRERFFSFDGWALDDNYYNTNAYRHPLQGAMNYIFARTNGFPPLESFLLSVALSSAWEFFGEYREEISINDMIVTPTAGYPIGEAFTQLGAFFLRSQDNWLNGIAGNVFGGGKGIMDWVDRNRPKHSTRLDRLGFDETVWHRFNAEISRGWTSNGAPNESFWKPVTRLALDSEIITIPELDKPGYVNKLLLDGNFSRLMLTSTWGPTALKDFRAYARAAVIAYYIKRDYNLLLGLVSAYEYNIHLSPGHSEPLTKDRIAVAHILGPTIDLTIYNGSFKLRAVIDVIPGFAFVRSFSLDPTDPALPEDSIKSTILRENYYHAFSIASTGRLIANYGDLEAGVEFETDLFDSIEGWDRHQDQLRDELRLSDRLTTARVWITYGSHFNNGLTLRMGATYEGRSRSGTALDETRTSTEHTFLGTTLIEF